jgi:hypothetical protein
VGKVLIIDGSVAAVVKVLIIDGSVVVVIIDDESFTISLAIIIAFSAVIAEYP